MKWLFTKQIRSRLTIWYVAVLAMILAIYIVLVFFFQYQFVSRQIFHDEVQDVETVEGLLRFDQHGVLQLQQDYFSRPLSHLLIDRMMEVHSLSGEVLYRTPNLKGMALGGALMPHEGDEGFDPRVIRLPDGSHVSVISHLHAMQGQTLLIRLGYSLAPFRQRMTQFLELLLIALPAALLIAGFAGYQIAKRGLAPLEDMAQKAQRISARNLHDRLNINNPDDELGHMAAVFNDLLNRLEEAFQQLHRFTADAAHELRAPMAAMRTIGEIALRPNLDGQNDKDAIASILEETARLEETVAGLLLLARAESTQAIGPNTFSLLELSNEVIAILDVLAEERHIEIVLNGDHATGFAASGDRGLIRSAIMNIVHNAIKFSPADSTITISHSIVERNGPFFRLTVKDQGPGVDATEREILFDRFYTSARRQTVAQSGAGLGLSIAKLVIERSGGQIWFEDDATSGAVCVVQLPAHPVLSATQSCI